MFTGVFIVFFLCFTCVLRVYFSCVLLVFYGCVLLVFYGCILRVCFSCVLLVCANSPVANRPAAGSERVLSQHILQLSHYHL